MRKSWTVQEDCKLLTLVRQRFSALVSHSRLNATMPFSQQLHAAFDSPGRDAAALLYRLEQAKILGFASRPGGDPTKQPFRCQINNELALYDYSLTFPTLRKALHPDTVASVLNHFTISNPHEPLSDTINEIATALYLAPMQVEKVLLESGQITINSYPSAHPVWSKYYEGNDLNYSALNCLFFSENLNMLSQSVVPSGATAFCAEVLVFPASQCRVWPSESAGLGGVRHTAQQHRKQEASSGATP